MLPKLPSGKKTSVQLRAFKCVSLLVSKGKVLRIPNVVSTMLLQWWSKSLALWREVKCCAKRRMDDHAAYFCEKMVGFCFVNANQQSTTVFRKKC